MLAYLKAENAYFEAAMKPHAALKETLFQEMKGRMEEFQAKVAEMTDFNEELVKAGVMLAGEGLHPSSKGARVRYSRAQGTGRALAR